MIKPHAVAENKIGDIISKIEGAGFSIMSAKFTQLTIEQAAKFYYEHRERPFYRSLCEIMSSGPVLAMGIYGDNAVEKFRELIGATNPAEAAEGTIRQLYGKSIDENAIHGSDSVENAYKEISFFFSARETYIIQK